MLIIEKNGNGMDKCFVAYDSLDESSFTRRFNAKNQIFYTKLRILQNFSKRVQ